MQININKDTTEQELIDFIVDDSTAVSPYTPSAKNDETPIEYYRLATTSIAALIELANRRNPSFIARELQQRFQQACRTAQTQLIDGDRKDTLSVEEKRERFAGWVARTALKSSGGMKKKRDKAITRTCATNPLRITEWSKAGLLGDLADNDGPIQDDASLERALLKVGVLVKNGNFGYNTDDNKSFASVADWLANKPAGAV